MLRKFFLATGFLLALGLIIGFLLPDEFEVKRQVEINAPVACPFEMVDNLRKNELWNPWLAQDSSMELTYSGPESGKDAIYQWKSTHSGNGSVLIIDSVPLSKIDLFFDFGDNGQGRGYWRFSEATKDGVQMALVEQRFTGNAEGSLIGRYWALMMDRFLGPSMEKGLNKIKELCEEP